MPKVNKRIGGSKRAQEAREKLIDIFSNPENNEYLLKDIEYAKQFDVTRHTIASIRRQLSVPARTERIVSRLKDIDTENSTLKELSTHLDIKYQNLYKIIKEKDIPVKPDVKPIEQLKKHSKNRKLRTIELIEKSGILKNIEKQLEDINIIQPPEIKKRKGRTDD